MTSVRTSQHPRPRRSERARYLAAEIRVEADRKLGRSTPVWISKLFSDGKQRFGE